ncbi:hypothetical protein NDI76_09260 [Halogeometricum sp. S1BR25-6]|uniref:Uncharacterized protein n=1 Tax=Halogeometricum salsisoli TaxID=2950536 RepID=A0ABU2GF63_9EURY|nr:hypothetical protein [Halogeometricum sp. S1BR25-6]MDS0298933.1 hypothetical protein [Halogeometricum sp. S1BR25-6]
MSDGGSEGNGESDIGTANTMRGRADESRVKIKFLLQANRLVVTGVLALFIFVGFIGFSVFLAPPLDAEITSADTIETIFSTMISVLVTGTTLVITINQLVLSQENGPLGDQRERMSDAMDFRTYAKDLLGQSVPADPSAFLQALVRETERRSEVVDRLAAEGDDEELREQVTEFVDSIHGNAQEVEDELDGASFGTFDVLFAALNFNYSWKIYQVERITGEFDDSLTDDQRRAFEDLRTSLSMFGPAREHIKTLYFQWALVNLSQYILYVAVPALLVAGVMLTFVGAETFGSTQFLDVPVITWVVSGAFTLTLIPFLLFTSYILRIATVAKRTLAIGPLVLRDSQR